jgi:hypothetical protein
MMPSSYYLYTAFYRYFRIPYVKQIFVYFMNIKWILVQMDPSSTSADADLVVCVVACCCCLHRCLLSGWRHPRLRCRPLSASLSVICIALGCCVTLLSASWCVIVVCIVACHLSGNVVMCVVVHRVHHGPSSTSLSVVCTALEFLGHLVV